MAEIKDVLKNLAIQIRDEHKVGANTAKRVGDLLCAFVDALGPDITELTKYFLRKDQDDTAEGLIKFITGIDIGEKVEDSLLAGMGILLKDGRIQADRMELRHSLTVLSLIINELQGMSSDFIFAEVGLVTKVDDLGENTFRLWIDKKTESDFLKFNDGDILKQIVNNMMLGGSDYYTSWMRILSSNLNNNTITVVLFPDSEVPGKVNFAPAADYTVAHRGTVNVPLDDSHNTRADHWYLSSREGAIRFLQNVFKPVLDDHNYALSIGRFPQIEAIQHLPIGENDMGILAKTIVAQNFFQYDYNGEIVTKEVPRGDWNLTIAQSSNPYRYITSTAVSGNGSNYQVLEQHTVYHLGCKWACLVDNTILEPKWNSPGWRMVEGNSEFNIRFSAKNDQYSFVGGIVDTVIIASLYYGNIDITTDVIGATGFDIEWMRDSGNVPDDNAWRPTIGEGMNQLILKSAAGDMGRDFLQRRNTRFICTMYIPVGGEYQTITESLNFNS